MQIRDTGMGYGVITLVIHWVAAAAIFGVIIFGLVMGRQETEVEKSQLIIFHASAGVIVFCLCLFRMYWRWRYFQPLPLGPASPIEVMVARVMALVLLFAGVAMPLIGWVAVSASGTSIELFGTYQLPAIVDPGERLAAVTSFLHRLGAYAFIAGLLLHMFGGFKHHFILKDKTLVRMFGVKVEP